MSRKQKNKLPGNLSATSPPTQQPAEDAPSAERIVQAVSQTLQYSSFSGPLPPPDQLEHYERVAPGTAHRIVAMAEEHISMAKSQMEHRHRIEGCVIESNVRLAGRGQVFAFILGIVGLAGAIFLIYEGREFGGATAFVASLASLAGVFVYSWKQQQKELARKRQEQGSSTLLPARQD